ncbi:hypothetical protein OAC76_05315, partial [Amylibacter sp.]|nr:hypothetical protein [Amylibacter sp.]
MLNVEPNSYSPCAALLNNGFSEGSPNIAALGRLLGSKSGNETREMRLYPNGKLAAHILGGTRFGEEGVRAAEIVGVGGVEKYFDKMLRDPALE